MLIYKHMNKYKKTYEYLNEKFPNPKCELNYINNFQLLIAVILSAQCTDKQVNKITNQIFDTYKTPYDFDKLTLEDIELMIKSCGLYKNKAKYIKALSKILVLKYNGQVPENKDELTKLPGVGSKTANVVLSEGFNQSHIAVDTHVFRVSNRIGLVEAKNVVQCEKQLQNNYKKENWSKIHYLLVLFGRYFCKARNPMCKDCELKSFCKYYEENY